MAQKKKGLKNVPKMHFLSLNLLHFTRVHLGGGGWRRGLLLPAGLIRDQSLGVGAAAEVEAEVVDRRSRKKLKSWPDRAWKPYASLKAIFSLKG